VTIKVCDTGFDPYAELRLYQDQCADVHGKFGATVSFVGTMRDFNDNETVQAMTLEHYPGMTEKYLDRIVVEAKQRWDIVDALVVHRVGALRPHEPIVLVAVWAAHRAPAFEAARYLIEELKARAPFWKKETRAQSQRWVEHNTPAVARESR
jgi:molybdopterin synthase catalytic subunit